MCLQFSAAHRCLNIVEVLHNIIANTEHKYTLLSLSLVCHAFLDPAMDALWCKLPGPEPLIMLFPEEIRGKELTEHLTLITAPSEADWAHFNKYAHRVRTLAYPVLTYYDDDDTGELDEWLGINWESIMRYHPGGPLLPNLHTFESDFELICEWYPLFIRAPLRHLRLQFWEMGEEKQVMQALHTCAQTLETLEIVVVGWDDIDPQGTLGLSHAMAQMQALTAVNVEMLLSPALDQLGSLRTLRELRFAVDAIATTTTPLPFPALERLELKTHMTHTASMVSVLRRLQAPALRDLTIAFSVKDPAEHMLPTGVRPTAAYVHAVLGAASAHTQLRAFSFATHSTFLLQTISHECVVDLRALAPLLALHALERVTLAETPVALAPGDTAQLAQAWPHARTVRLGDKAHGAHGALPLHELLPFAHGCPHLETLGLPLRFDDADAEANLAATAKCRDLGFAGAPLKVLRTIGGTTSFGTETVVFLGSVFPHATLRSAVLEEAGSVKKINEAKRAFLRILAAEDHGSLKEQARELEGQKLRSGMILYRYC